jgi:hypothetical protein
MKIKLFIAASVLFITAYLAYSYIYQGHRNVLAEKATISLTSEELFENFNNPSKKASQNFINKIIDFKGSISAIESDFIVIKPSIVCVLDSNFFASHLTIGDTLLLKGRCIGFDDLFMEVKMDHVSFK